MPNILYDCNSRRLAYEDSNGIIKFPKFSRSNNFFESFTSYKTDCILGILNVGRGKYLYFCTESELIGTFEDVKYYKIMRIKYLLLNDHSGDGEAEQIKILIESLGFYYTFNDMEEEFTWNQSMLRNFEKDITNMITSTIIEDEFETGKKEYKEDNGYRSPFITTINTVINCDTKKNRFLLGKMFCGYFETQIVRDEKMLYFLKIHSRISTKKIGPRMLSRGVDENGDVSFFVETKFTIKNEQERSEFTILRGSVPVYWSQHDPLQPRKISLEKDYDANKKAFNKHFEKLTDQYGKIVIVDLMGEFKYEKALSDLYKGLCKENKIDYLSFDLNAYAKNFESLKIIFYDKLIKHLSLAANSGDSIWNGNIDRTFDLSDRFKEINIAKSIVLNRSNKQDLNSSSDSEEAFESIDLDEIEDNDSDNMWSEPESSIFTNLSPKTGKKINDLNIVFRVNCMDCLDRTNLCQYLLFSFSQTHKFKIIKGMWANNGNALSNMYTGSNALKSDLPSKGKMTFFGKVNDFVISANRMINNRFTDKDKQQAIDLLLGKKTN